jgi:hypothetical protein
VDGHFSGRDLSRDAAARAEPRPPDFDAVRAAWHLSLERFSFFSASVREIRSVAFCSHIAVVPAAAITPGGASSVLRRGSFMKELVKPSIFIASSGATMPNRSESLVPIVNTTPLPVRARNR